MFSDQDPEGLIIAMTTPGYAGLAFPPLVDVREKFLEGQGLRDMCLAQLPKAEAQLEACEEPDVSAYWGLMKEFGRALLQEEFVR